MKKVSQILIQLIVLYVFFAYIAVLEAFADEIVLSISQNGEGSSNEVSTESLSSTSVTQQNTSDITNEAAINANTGSNEASNNNGDVSIQTGDISTNTQILNQNININSLESDDCLCSSDISLEVGNNGMLSENNIYTDTINNINVLQDNIVNIDNKIQTSANTGHNLVSGNMGDTYIDTGNIKAANEIRNEKINFSLTDGIVSQIDPNVHIKIQGNKEGSKNSIIFNKIQNVSMIINNYSVITNLDSYSLNTGFNIANGNNGNVFISTGDIDVATSVSNVGINLSSVRFTCCTVNNPNSEDPSDPATPLSTLPNSGSSTNNNNNSSVGGSGGGGEVLSATGSILPVTGSSITFLLTLLSLILFLSGLCLRFRSGLAPPAYLAFA